MAGPAGPAGANGAGGTAGANGAAGPTGPSDAKLAFGSSEASLTADPVATSDPQIIAAVPASGAYTITAKSSLRNASAVTGGSATCAITLQTPPSATLELIDLGQYSLSPTTPPAIDHTVATLSTAKELTAGQLVGMSCVEAAAGPDLRSFTRKLLLTRVGALTTVDAG